MKLIKILPGRIQIKTNNADFAGVRLNDLISVSDGEVELVTQVCAITDNDTETQMDDNAVLAELEEPSLKVIECAILGSVVDGTFWQQIDRYSSVAAEICKMNDSMFGGMLADSSVGSCFTLGNYSSYDFPARLNGNKFFQRHSCVVGNTGSGKSETIAKILEETAKQPAANIILFDIHGEYSGLSYVDSIKIGSETPFPIWAFGLSDMAANILKIKEESATVAMSALRKAYRAQCPDGNEGKPEYFDFEDMKNYMDAMNRELLITGYTRDGDPKTAKGEFNGKLYGVINSMESFFHNKRYQFLFENVDGDYLKCLINRIMGGSRPVKSIDLSDVPHDIAILIIGVIAKLIYGIQTTQKGNIIPRVLVCDEAHVYIPNDFQLSASQRRMVEIFENIAKEGRKFGITLMVASQRPSELNKTIVAQCENFIVMKLNNENDKAIMKDKVPVGKDIIDSVTMFSPGDCIVIGNAAPIPLKIHVELAKERPQSRTIDFWNIWGKDKPEIDYGKALEDYLRS